MGNMQKLRLKKIFNLNKCVKSYFTGFPKLVTIISEFFTLVSVVVDAKVPC